MKLPRHSALALFLAAAAVPVHGQHSAPPADTVYEPGSVSVLPRPLNQAEFVQAMNDAYPQALRDVGMPGTVQVRFVIGADGAPRDFQVTASSVGFLEVAAIQALSVLRFSPAELDGRPVSMWAELPVKWRSAAPAASGDVHAHEMGEVDLDPAPINVNELVHELGRLYPVALRDAGVQGEVMVCMRVDPEGVPHAVTVVQTDHPGFAEPTVTAVRSLRFRPAQVDGTPVWVWVCIPVQWQVGNVTFFASPRPDSPGESGRPAAVRPTLLNPEVLARALVEGSEQLRGAQVTWGRVVVQFRVGADGIPHEVRVEKSVDRQLNAPSIALVRQLRFAPGTVNGRPVAVPMQLPIDWAPPR